MLVGRDDVISEGRRRLQLGANVLLHGRTGAGCSTVANHIVRGMAVHRTGLVDDLAGVAIDLDRDRPVTDPLEVDLTGRLARLDSDVICIDAPIPGRLPSQFAAMRDIWWAAAPIRWVLTVTTGDHVEWTRRPIDTFFDVFEVGPLCATDATELLTRRATKLDVDDAQLLTDLIATIVQVTDRLPGSLIRTARTSLSSPDPHAWAHNARMGAEQAAELSSSHRAVIDHLQAHGPTSASDPTIQTAAGVTRGPYRPAAG